MKCPACFNPLTQLTVGSLTVDVCRGGCGGIWCDAFELQTVDEPQESAGQWLINVERNPRLQVDHGRKRDCPKCDGVKLKRHYFSAKKKVEVDQCPGCAGYWLDAGEVEKIRDEMGQAAQLKELAAVRIDSAVIRYIYRMKTAARAEP
jgi:Zn-finger nucleic acid-binding protein